MSPGPKRKRAEVSPDVRAAVIAALLAGQAVNAVAATYNLPEGTVKSIKHRMKGERPHTTPGQQEEIGVLILESLRENVKATASLARLFTDDEWARKQSAQELAVLYGVLSDKGVRLLEALDTPSGNAPEGEGGDPPDVGAVAG